MAVALAGPYANNLHLIADITSPTIDHSIFTGHVLFLMPNQQCQSAEGKFGYTLVSYHAKCYSPIAFCVRIMSPVWRAS